MPDPGIFQFIGESVDAALISFVMATAAEVIAAIMPIATLGVTIYFAIMGYMLIAGRLQNPAGAVMIQGIKFLAISALALSVSGYNTWVVDVIRGLEDGLASAFAGTAGAAPMSVYATIDTTLGQGWDIAADLWEQAGNRGLTEIPMAIGEYVNAIVIGISTLIVGLPAGAMIVVAKATLILLLGIGPLVRHVPDVPIDGQVVRAMVCPGHDGHHDHRPGGSRGRVHDEDLCGFHRDSGYHWRTEHAVHCPVA